MSEGCTRLSKLLAVEVKVIRKHLSDHKWFRHIQNDEDAIANFIQEYGWLMREMYCNCVCESRAECSIADKLLGNEMSRRKKLPMTREWGKTSSYNVGAVELKITVNGEAGKPLEMFCKASDGRQGEMDGLCIMASLALQHGCPPRTVIQHLRYRRYTPEGFIRQPSSLSDALGQALEAFLQPGGSDEEGQVEPA